MDTTVSKNKTAKVGEKYSYKYVDIAQIHEYLQSIGMHYYQFIDRIDGDDYIMTVKVDQDGNEGKPLRGCRVVDATLVGVNNPAQCQGSALTYARRYSLLMAFGLATEDDDAQSLSTAQTAQEEKKATPKQLEIIRRNYTGDNMTKLLDRNGISNVEDLPMAKASELIEIIFNKNREGK